MISTMNFSTQSALFARISNLVYKAPRDAKKVFDSMGYTSTYYQSKGSNVFVLEDSHDIIVACRGTEAKEWKDIRTNLTIDLVPSRTGIGEVHRGFRNYVDNVWYIVRDHILDNPNKKLWLTGHSLGAAMATLMAKRFVSEPVGHPVEALFTYGSPRVGNKSYINTFNEKVVHHRWVNDGDIVTKVPFSPWYYHCGTKHGITQDGLVIKNSENKHSIKSVINFVFSWYSMLKKDIASHSSELYVQRISAWSINNTGNE